jgi:putative DNA primase/helicase
MSSGPPRPHALSINIDDIPAVLIARPQWVSWRYERRHSQWTKVPKNPNRGKNARTDDPTSWGTFAQALRSYQQHQMEGMGFVFSLDDPFAGIDLDRCRNPVTGQIEPWADTIIREVDSYTEISPSATGVKIVACAAIPPGGNRKGQVEMYDHGRYFTLTGHHLPGTPRTIEVRQAAIDALHTRLFTAHCQAPAAIANRLQSPLTCNDEEILTRAFSARNGYRFARLWAGDVSGYASHSEADAALCTMIAFWCGPDAERIDRLFRRSGLYREKWERVDYQEATIGLALRRSPYWMPNNPHRGAMGRGLLHAWNTQTRRHRAVVLGR